LNARQGGRNDREGEQQLVQMFRDSFGDFTSTIEDQIAEGNQVVTRWTAVGKHQAPFLGIPPTGKLIPMKGTEMARISEGQITDIFAIFDMADLMQQLGRPPARPPPAPPVAAPHTTSDSLATPPH